MNTNNEDFVIGAATCKLHMEQCRSEDFVIASGKMQTAYIAVSKRSNLIVRLLRHKKSFLSVNTAMARNDETRMALNDSLP